ncbi:MAG: COX15/CtaA family protein, partial [Bdellovibrionaceae bacterium]|nr:COX15/CtaA family protein [Pseudobdellovibrionaceae bacterium]
TQRLQNNRYLLMILILAMTGAWAALSTTLFPSVSLLEGFAKDFATDSHSILKIRITHPILAVSFGIYMIYYFANKYSEWKDSVGDSQGLIKYQNLEQIVGRLAKAMAFSVFLAVLIGIITLLSLSPTSLKLIHLTLAHVLWMLSVSYYHFSSLKKRLNIE